VYEADVEDVDQAVEAAEAAFASWSQRSAVERGAYLFKLADAIEENVRCCQCRMGGRRCGTGFGCDRLERFGRTGHKSALVKLSN